MRSPRYLTSALAARLHRNPASRTAADRIRSEYGRALADEVATPLLEAWSGLPAEELAPSILDKIPGGIGETVARRVTHRPIAIGYCAEAPQSANLWHVYPRDGLGVFTDRLVAQLAPRIHLNTWTPGRELPFFRVTETPMAVPWLAPAGETVLTVDIGARVGDRTWTADADALAPRCLDALARMIPDVHTRVIDVYSTRTPIAYPVFALSPPSRRATPSPSTASAVW